MDQQYWENYYRSQSPSDQPSDFAQFCQRRYASEWGRMVDVGCGNGRDTLFFAMRSVPCLGVDQCSGAIAKNQAKADALALAASFKQDDFCGCEFDRLANGPHSVYSRFTLHAINRVEEQRFMSNVLRAQSLQYLLIEARTIRDALYGQGTEVGTHEFVTTHYRRFIDPEELRRQLESDFQIEYFEEAQGFARVGDDDPCLVRVIARRRR